MEMAQKAPEKVQAIIDKNKKIDILVAFKAAYPDAVINFKEAELVEAEPEVDEEAIKAVLKAEALAVEKAIKKAELEAELKALDES